MSEITQDTQLAKPEKQKNETPNKAFGIGSIILMGLFIVIAAGVGIALLRQFQGREMDGLAPTFDFTSFDGETYALEDFQGQVVVLNFWASWCVGCVDEAPDLQSTWEKYKSQDVMFIGIAYADSEVKSLAFLEHYGITYPNAPDIGANIVDKYDVLALPQTFIIDQNGNIVRLFIDRVMEEQLSAVIDNLLDEI